VTQPPSITFVVPALNEAAHIRNTLQTMMQAVEQSRVSDYEIIFVDDGSTDDTGKLMDEAARHNSHIRVLHNERNLGFGEAYNRGAAQARCDYVMIVAGDNIMPASSMVEILSNLGKADIILPYMTDTKDRPLLRRAGSRAYTMLINALFGQTVRYYNSMVPRRDLLQSLTIRNSGYAFQAECVTKLLRAGHTCVHVGVPHGHKHAQTGSHAIRPKNLVNLFKGIVSLFREVRRT
jgi:glycosyltransferase involved in cell wall biosynthesis